MLARTSAPKLTNYIIILGYYTSSIFTIKGTRMNPKYLSSLRGVCGQVDTPTIVRSPFRNNEVMFRTRSAKYTTPDLGFNITYNIYDI